MPRGDGSGPMGMGPMTGRGAGTCAGFVAPGCMKPGIGFGRGLRRMFYHTGMPGWARSGYSGYGGAYAPAADEKEFLSNQAEFLENQLQQVKKRLKVINGEEE